MKVIDSRMQRSYLSVMDIFTDKLIIQENHLVSIFGGMHPL